MLSKFRRGAISSAVKRIFEKAGLHNVLPPHNLQHTFGSWLLKQTGDLSHVQCAMRHLDIGLAKLYMHTVVNDCDPTRTFGNKKGDNTWCFCSSFVVAFMILVTT